MKKGSEDSYLKGFAAITVLLFLVMTVGCATSGNKSAGQSSAAATAQVSPMAIPTDVSCGKCGMYPANYPRWHSQIVFKDGKMTPFDGCKCMFNFIFAMDQYDKMHTRDDVAAMLVKDFNTGKWFSVEDAYFVVGSNMMGPMGKELIPFAEHAEAMKFHHEQGGSMMMYADITPEVLKSLMGGMKHGHGHGGHEQGHHDSKHMGM